MIEEAFREAEALGERDDHEGALAVLRKALRRGAHGGDPAAEADLRLALAQYLVWVGRPGEARDEAARARALDPTAAGEALLLEGIARYHAWDLEGAGRCFQDLRLAGEHRAWLLTYQARLLEMEDRHLEADRLYARAARLAPRAFPMPARLRQEEVEELVEEVLGSLPPPIAKVLENVVLEVRPLPDPAALAGPDTDPDLLGIYVGMNMLEKSALHEDPSLDRVMLFQRNIERVGRDAQGVREEIRVTLLHEIGHHLGWDEEDLDERGLG